MTLIDLTDDEGMFGLYVEFVADARAESQDDPIRLRFVEDMLSQLESMRAALDETPLPTLLEELRALHESVDRGFAHDPVLVHLGDLIDALEDLDR